MGDPGVADNKSRKHATGYRNAITSLNLQQGASKESCI